MDKTDRAIIEELGRNGRLSNAELAERVRLSPSPCLRRVRQLEAAGVITGYHAAIDRNALGRGFEVLVHVMMTVNDRATVESFEYAIAGIDEVTECRRMFGEPDYLLWVEVASQAAYRDFYLNTLAVLPGVARITSQLTMLVVKSTVPGRLPPGGRHSSARRP
jgi:DNA-binding Lrp family transcriptional regulator